jgi:hypothetical protein
MNEESRLKKIYHFILRLRTRTLVNALFVSGVSILVLGAVFQKYEADFVQGTLIALSFFVIGLAGVIMIIRREADFSIISFDGWPAVLIGIVTSISGFVVSAALLVGIMRSFAK